MVPTAEQTAANQQLMAGVCRLIGVLMLVVAGYGWIGQIEFGLVYGAGAGTPGPGWLGRFMASVWDATYWYPLTLVLLGIAFWRSADRIAAGLIRIPTRNRCPGCGYSLDALGEPRCPECGIALTEAFLDRVGPEPTAEPRAICPDSSDSA